MAKILRAAGPRKRIGGGKIGTAGGADRVHGTTDAPRTSARATGEVQVRTSKTKITVDSKKIGNHLEQGMNVEMIGRLMVITEDGDIRQ